MKLPLSSAVMWRQRSDLAAAYSYLKDSYKDNGAKLFSGVADNLTRGKTKVLQLRRFTLGIKRKILQWETSATLEPTPRWKVCPLRVSRFS